VARRPATSNQQPATSDQQPATERPVPNPQPPIPDGADGWDAYAPFYDWENAQTLGRRDVPFWRRVAAEAGGPVLELGCGTGRVSIPVARAGVRLAEARLSAPMLDRARQRAARRSPIPSPRSPIPSLQPPHFIRGDIRRLPFRAGAFSMVIAPYGILQSLTRPRDLADTLAAVSRGLPSGALFRMDLVPDVPNWREYRNRVQLRGRSRGAQLTLIESVSQDRKRRLTTFEQRYVERRGRDSREHQFTLTFRTLSVPEMVRQLERAGFAVESVLGDYRGRPWDARADVWILLAKRV